MRLDKTEILGAGSRFCLLGIEIRSGVILKIKAVFDLTNKKTFFNHNIASIEEIKNYNGIFVVTNLNSANEILGMLKKIGVPKNNIIII